MSLSAGASCLGYTARVLAVRPGAVTLDPSSGACGLCSGAACTLMGRSTARPVTLPDQGLDLAVGDEILVQVPEHAIVLTALIAYGLPLSMLSGATVAATLAQLGDAAAAGAAALGLAAGVLLATRLARRFPRHLRPRLRQRTRGAWR